MQTKPYGFTLLSDDEVETVKRMLVDCAFEYTLKEDRAKIHALCKRFELNDLAVRLAV